MKENTKKLKKFKLAKLTVAISLVATSSQFIYAEKIETSVKLKPLKVHAENEDAHALGKKEQFKKDVVNTYLDKDQIDKFKGTTPSDLLSGIAGTYSNDGRNSGSLSPNIRGINGEGRIPVVVDGSRNEVTVYRGYAGVNNRNYLDPNLVSSLAVYKGPTESTYGQPQGIGGRIEINTLSVDDVISKGKNVGINLRYETNNNTVKPRFPKINYGEDFRTTENWGALLGDNNPSLFVPMAENGKNKFFESDSYRFAFAAKNDLTDVLVAYSKRNQGNYFSGKKNGDVYKSRFNSTTPQLQISVAEFAKPGFEVANTSSENESFLIKNNWYLPNDQTIKMNWRNTQMSYGEIMSTRVVYAKAMQAMKWLDADTTYGSQWDLAKVKQNAGRIDYNWNPQDNPWIDLKLGGWLSKTSNQNNASGAEIVKPQFVSVERNANGGLIDSWDKRVSEYCFQNFGGINKCAIPQDQIDQWKQIPGINNFKHPTTGEEFAPVLVNPAMNINRNERFGFDISNKFQLLPTLSLTLGGGVEKEKLVGRSGVPQQPLSCSSRECSNNVDFFIEPKSGERDEYNAWTNINWQATQKLNLNVGVRWGKYSLLDTKLNSQILAKKKTRPATIDFYSYPVHINQKDVRISDDELRALHQKNPELGFVTYTYDEFDEDFYRDFYGSLDNYEELYGDKQNGDIVQTEWLDHRAYFKYLGYTDNNGFDTLSRDLKWYTDENGHLNAKDAFKNQPLRDKEFFEAKDQYGFKGREMSEAEKYQPVDKVRDRSLDPSFALSYAFTPFNRAYARYTQATRFPSVFEGSSGQTRDMYPFYKQFKPEQARNVEIGYAHDLKQWLPNLKNADIKLNYYQNKIKNVIDQERDISAGRFTQYDQLKTKGIEFQSQFDQGRIYTELSYSYLIKSELCDEIKMLLHDPVGLKGIPSCYIGGFPGGNLRNSSPPKHSIVFNLGSRWFDEKLNVGTRVSYQSMSNISKQVNEKKSTINVADDTYGWKSYWNFDAYGDLKLSEQLKLSLIGTNLTNEYYPDAVTRTYQPAPGRTFKIAVDYKF